MDFNDTLLEAPITSPLPAPFEMTDDSFSMPDPFAWHIPLMDWSLLLPTPPPPIDFGTDYVDDFSSNTMSVEDMNEIMLQPTAIDTLPDATSDVPQKRVKRSKGGFHCQNITCVRTFDTRSDLRKHEKSHLPENARPFACQSCDRRFWFPKDLNRHASSQHPNGHSEPATESRSRVAKRPRLSENHRGCSRLLSKQELTVVRIDGRDQLRDRPANAAARRQLDFIEMTFKRCRQSYPNGERHSQLGDVVAIKGPLIVIAPSSAVSELSCDFNPASELKFRSLRVLRHISKLVQEFEHCISNTQSPKRKLILLNPELRQPIIRDIEDPAHLRYVYALICRAFSVPTVTQENRSGDLLRWILQRRRTAIFQDDAVSHAYWQATVNWFVQLGVKEESDNLLHFARDIEAGYSEWIEFVKGLNGILDLTRRGLR